MAPRRPTQTDVARRAGVSRSTVSIVLSNRETTSIPISEETRQRVRRAAEGLGYMPNPAAQMLAQGSTKMIAVFSFGDRFPTERVHKLHDYVVGIEREAGRQDYNVLLITRGQSSGHRSIYAGGVNALRVADGAILMGWAEDYREVQRLAQEDYPFIYIGRRDVPDTEIDWISGDHVQAGIMAVQHLYQLGHRRLAFIWGGPTVEEIQDRLEGCRQAIADLMDAQLDVFHINDPFEANSLVAQIKQTKTTGLIGGMTSLSQVMDALQSNGMIVPNDISFISLTNDNPSQWKWPHIELPCILADQIRIGELSVQALLRRLREEPACPQQILVPVKLCRQNSTGPAPSS